ncbi:MAG: acyl carrier protein [Candidatus Eremiobacteraeota bacterium]|nr:acyl carrier protein [Candidatus Eremiobacteraeota bacterium]
MTEHDDPLYRLVADVFNVDASGLSESSSQDTLPQWDSLGMVNLIAELELRFGVQFELLEIADFVNLGVIRTILREKGVAV